MRLNRVLILLALLCVCVSSFAQAPKKLPLRDPKTGRFMKSTTKSLRNLPPRDPKTGRFVKANSAKLKMPRRDAKTGRFIKSK